jgi:hypothetical protein
MPPFEPHPTDPDKLIMRPGKYNLPQPWRDLTHEQLEDIYSKHHDSAGNQVSSGFSYERAIEAALRAQNGGAE